MTSSEERSCHQCGTYHLRNISFFAYWTQCKACGTYLCPRHSGYQNSRLTQFTFLGYMLISFFYYFGIFLIIAPSIDEGIDLLFSYSLAGLLLFIPFLGLLLIILSAIRRLSKQTEIPNCPQCNGLMSVLYHDIFLYFWLFLMHTLYIATISNEIGIIFYKLDIAGFLPSLLLVYILVGVIIPIIWFFKRIGGRFMPRYKMNTRVWVGELFAIFLYISVNVILILIISIITNLIPIPLLTNDTNISFNIFYTFTSVAFWYFPAFLIGSLFYKLAQKYLLNVNKSRIAHILIGVLFIIMPFYLWGLISFSLGLHNSPGFSSGIPEAIIPFYSTAFNEVIPLFIISFLLGIGIISIFRKYLMNTDKIQQKFLLKITIIIGILLFTGFIFVENFYYLITGTLLLDSFSPSIVPFILMGFLIVSLVLLFNELISNWSSPNKGWGKTLENNLGSLLYPVIIGFIIMALSLSFSIIILTSSSMTFIPDYSISADLYTLKLIFLISFITGLLIGVKKKIQ
ncbi:MAG: hypothetical protein HWN66_05975 [Candidatus Helarchaeota archaeon]|nr:hypothetical protein [Candidatus Helarchaeota archaeon]